MKVFAVVELETNPYGERMGDGKTVKLFMDKDKAKEFKKKLVRSRLFGPDRGSIGTYTIRSMKVED